MQLDNMLLQACKNNQKTVVQTFLKRGGIDVNKRDESGNTPLIYACLKSARDLVKLLLDNGADAGLGNQKNRMPIHFAAEAGNFQIISMLCNAGADVNCTDNNGVTPLMLLAQNGKTDAALKLLQNPDIDISIKDNEGRMAIDYATSSGLRELVKALTLAEDAHADSYGNTTLHHACWNGQGEVVKILLEKDPASVNKPNDEGESPLILAVRKSNLAIVELLLAAGALPSLADSEGVLPLHIAADKGDLFVGKTLLAAGADANQKTSEGQTPLILAAQKGKNDFTAMLIEKGADVNAVDNSQHSAMFYASEAGYTEIVEQLLIAGAEN
ncbi:phosphocholine transferase AnkX [Lachnospiraceae bacterium]|nr:phosphocholine transferase AnkX [Lachnospiraceae bacterium]